MIEYAKLANKCCTLKAIRNPYISGYGRKIPTQYLVKTQGNNHWHRVYSICYSNVASFYIIEHGKMVMVNETDLQ